MTDLVMTPDEKSSADSQGLQSAQNLQSLQNLIDRSVASAGPAAAESLAQNAGY